MRVPSTRTSVRPVSPAAGKQIGAIRPPAYPWPPARSTSTRPRRGGHRRSGDRAGSALDRLGLQELLQAEAAHLAAVAGLLVAAEGGEQIHPRAVDVYLPCAHPLGDGERVLLLAEDGAVQAVDGAVGDLNGVVVVGVGDDRQYGAEDLL